jgi:hypothetical protein
MEETMKTENRCEKVRCHPAWICGLMLPALLLLGTPDSSQAQSLVVAQFSGKPRKLRARARAAVVQSLRNEDATIVPFKKYLRTARRNRIKKKWALGPRNIRRLAQKMELDGVVTGSVVRKGRKIIVKVRLLGPDGQLLMKKVLRTRKTRAIRKAARRLASDMMRRLEVASAVAEEPPEESETQDIETWADTHPSPLTPEEEEPPSTEEPAATATVAASAGESHVPWAYTENYKEDSANANASTVSGGASWKSRRSIGSVPDIQVAIGAGSNARTGLPLKHDSGFFPALRVDAHLFLGSFLDVPVLRDIGFGGMYDMSVGLQYQVNLQEDKWDASQMHWQGELIYRLSFDDVALSPAFLFRAGYGSIRCSQDTDEPLASDTVFSSPYAALDIHVMLHKPWLTLYVSGGYHFLVDAEITAGGSSSSTDWSGWGFNVGAGLGFNPLSSIYIGVGYELTRYAIENEGEEATDLYHGFFGRVGWQYH